MKAGITYSISCSLFFTLISSRLSSKQSFFKERNKKFPLILTSTWKFCCISLLALFLMEIFLLTYPVEDFVANGVGSQIVRFTWCWTLWCLWLQWEPGLHVRMISKWEELRTIASISVTLSAWKQFLWQILVTEDLIKTLMESVIERHEKLNPNSLSQDKQSNL